MLREGAQENAFGGAGAFDLIRPGADRAHVEFLALLLEGLAADDRGRECRDDAAVEQRVWPLEGEPDRVGIGRRHCIDDGIQRLLVGDDLRVEVAAEREQDVVRRQLAEALVELHPPAQLEGPGLRVLRGFPALRQAGAEVLGTNAEGAIVRLREGVEDLLDRPVVAARQAVLLWVDARRRAGGECDGDRLVLGVSGWDAQGSGCRESGSLGQKSTSRKRHSRVSLLVLLRCSRRTREPPKSLLCAVAFEQPDPATRGLECCASSTPPRRTPSPARARTEG